MNCLLPLFYYKSLYGIRACQAPDFLSKSISSYSKKAVFLLKHLYNPTKSIYTSCWFWEAILWFQRLYYEVFRGYLCHFSRGVLFYEVPLWTGQKNQCSCKSKRVNADPSRVAADPNLGDIKKSRITLDHKVQLQILIVQLLILAQDTSKKPRVAVDHNMQLQILVQQHCFHYCNCCTCFLYLQVFTVIAADHSIIRVFS